MITTDLIMKEIHDIKNLSDFSNGVNISYSEMKGWIREGLTKCKEKMIKDNLKETFSSQSTGNGKIFIEVYRQDNDKFTVHITAAAMCSSGFETQNFK